MQEQKTLLVVDDDPDDLELFSEAVLLVDPGVQIMTASSGAECMVLLNNMAVDELPHFLVLDFNLNDMSGAELLSKIAADKRYDSLTKIVWSTSDLQQYRDECAKRGARLYVKKPNTFPQVVDMAKKLLSFSA
jgi:CheY-like chemotaxis protein